MRNLELSKESEDANMMRDKLVKTGHRAWYYRFRKLGIATAFIVALGLIAIVPARQISIEIRNLQAAQNSEKTEAQTPELGDITFEE